MTNLKEIIKMNRSCVTGISIADMTPNSLLKGDYWKYYPNLIAQIIISSHKYLGFSNYKKIYLLWATHDTRLLNLFDIYYTRGLDSDFIIWYIKNNIKINPVHTCKFICIIFFRGNLQAVYKVVKWVYRLSNPCKKIILDVLSDHDFGMYRLRYSPVWLYLIYDNSSAFIILSKLKSLLSHRIQNDKLRTYIINLYPECLKNIPHNLASVCDMRARSIISKIIQMTDLSLKRYFIEVQIDIFSGIDTRLLKDYLIRVCNSVDELNYFIVHIFWIEQLAKKIETDRSYLLSLRYANIKNNDYRIEDLSTDRRTCLIILDQLCEKIKMIYTNRIQRGGHRLIDYGPHRLENIS